MPSLPPCSCLCRWSGDDPLDRPSHGERGCPVADDRRLFEKICLEGFQAGTRVADDPAQARAFRDASFGFEDERVARMGARDVAAAPRQRGHRAPSRKDRSDASHANRAREIKRRNGTLAAYLLGLRPGAAARPQALTPAALAGDRDAGQSGALAKDWKRRGSRFVGPDDHLCVHAGDGARERPRARLRHTRSRARGPRALRTASLNPDGTFDKTVTTTKR